jgi:hypothetical protein
MEGSRRRPRTVTNDRTLRHRGIIVAEKKSSFLRARIEIINDVTSAHCPTSIIVMLR